MDSEKKEMICAACQCAPVMLGVKSSNLLMTKVAPQINPYSFFGKSDLKVKHLHGDMYLVYRKDWLQAELTDKEVQGFLRSYGYQEFQVEKALDKLSARVRVYREYNETFPHEMGVFLGYPLKDVIGFIDNKGRNYKYSGYWKVYDDVDLALQLEELYRKSRTYVTERILAGASVAQLITPVNQKSKTMI